MLVLSRKQNQRIVFSNLGITISVVAVDRRRAKLGFEAPNDVKILREELATDDDLQPAKPQLDRRAIRSRLDSIMSSLHVLSHTYILDPIEGDAAITTALQELAGLNRELDGEPSVSAAPPEMPWPTGFSRNGSWTSNH